MPRRMIAVLDAETDPFDGKTIPKPFIWGLLTEKGQYWKFDDTDKAIDFLEDKNWIVYCHNGGKFDFLYFLHRIPIFEPLMVVSGRLVKFNIGKCEYRDSYAILPMPLANYKKDNFNYDLMKKAVRQYHTKEIEKYLYNDCKYTLELILAFIDEFGLEITLPTAALKKLCKIEGLKRPESTRWYFEDCSKFYYGGRCECFEYGAIHGDSKNSVKVIDINSAYPFAMMEEHPWGTDYNEIADDNPDLIPQHFYNLDCISKGAFPYRVKDGIFFPHDEKIRNYHITGWELITALELGLITNVKHIYHLEFTELQSFRNYVTKFYNQKKASVKNSIAYIFAKFCLNTSYGKLCANPSKYCDFMIAPKCFEQELVNGDPDIPEDEGEWNSHDSIEGNLLFSKPIDESEQHYLNVACGASITGFVRAYLLRALYDTERPLYCDTDSIIYIGETLAKIGQELGTWDLEGEFNIIYIGGKKMYALITKGKVKKASKGARLSFKQLKAVALGATIKYHDQSPQFSLKNGIRFVDRNIKATRALTD